MCQLEDMDAPEAARGRGYIEKNGLGNESIEECASPPAAANQYRVHRSLISKRGINWERAH